MKRLSATLLFLAALALVPAAIAFERLAPETWRQRLAVPGLETEISRHTPLHSAGTFLPPKFTQDTTLTAADNPVILSARTEVPAGITLTLAPGVTLFAHEFAELSVFGTLRLQGSEKESIILTTNERHPQNQVWNGIIVENGGQAEISYAKFEHASPALTCEAGSQAEFSNNEIKNALIGIFTNSPDCTFSNNRIQSIRDQVVSKF